MESSESKERAIQTIISNQKLFDLFSNNGFVTDLKTKLLSSISEFVPLTGETCNNVLKLPENLTEALKRVLMNAQNMTDCEDLAYSSFCLLESFVDTLCFICVQPSGEISICGKKPTDEIIEEINNKEVEFGSGVMDCNLSFCAYSKFKNNSYLLFVSDIAIPQVNRNKISTTFRHLARLVKF